MRVLWSPAPVMRVAMAAFAFVSACAAAAAAQTYTALYTYPEDSRGHTGIVPPGLMAQGRDGKLYGTIEDNGALATGTAFSMTTSGTYTAVYPFCQQSHCIDGSQPLGGLVAGSDGNLYGTTQTGGATNEGTVFRLTTAGRLTKFHDFTGNTDGGYPQYPPFLAPNGNLYGAGSEVYSGDYGLVYELAPHSQPPGKFTLLTDFNYTNGSGPNMPVLAADGNMYGTTVGGGDPTCRCGVVYRLTPKKKLTVLHIFKGYPNDGTEPMGALAIGRDGSFYGTTYAGGATNQGSIFKITPAGKYTQIYSFTYSGSNTIGLNPLSGLVLGSDGNFYGAIRGGQNGYGLLYRVTSAGTLTELYSLCPPPTNGCPTGFNPQTPLIQHTNGKFYGSTGGNSNGGSVFYQLDVGLKPFIAVTTPAATAGQLVTIMGQGFGDATQVRFNGVPARFSATGDGSLTALVPPGATSGFVTVTTRGGMLASNRPFTIVR